MRFEYFLKTAPGEKGASPEKMGSVHRTLTVYERFTGASGRNSATETKGFGNFALFGGSHLLPRPSAVTLDVEGS